MLHLLILLKGYLTVPVFLEHLGYTDGRQITCFYLENVWNAIEQNKKDEMFWFRFFFLFTNIKAKKKKYKHPNKTTKPK